MENRLSNKSANLLSDKEKNEINTERYDMKVFVVFYFLGTLVAIPQHFFITASDYWKYKFRNTTDPSSPTRLQAEFFATYSTVSATTSIIALLVTLTLATMVSIHKRVVGAMALMIVLFFTILAFTIIDTDSWQTEFYILSIVLGATLRASGSFLNIPLVQLAAKFPRQFLAALITGQSLCGVIASLVQIIALLIYSESHSSGLLYFSMGGVLVLGATVSYFAIYYKSDYFIEKYNIDDNVEQEKVSWPMMKTNIKKIIVILLAFIFTMGATSMLHPGVTSLGKSVNEDNRFNKSYFLPVYCYLFFNLCDVLGRELGRMFTLKTSQLGFLAIALARFAIITPLMLLCNLQPRQNLPVVFNSDAAYAIMIMILALSQGYITNSCILIMPGLIDPAAIKVSFLLILLLMMTTLMSFSYLSIAVVKFV